MIDSKFQDVACASNMRNFTDNNERENFHKEAEIMSRADLTAVKEKWFFEALAEDGNATRAALVAGYETKSVYRKKRSDSAFAEAWDAAIAMAADRLEAEALRRAAHGVAKPLYYQGQPVYLYRTVVDENNVPQKDEEGREIREVVRDANGQPVQATEYSYSDSLMAMLLKGAKPEKYRDKSAVELTGAGGGPLELSAVSDTERARRIAFTLQQGLIAAQQGTVVATQTPKAAFEAEGEGEDMDDLL